MQFACFSVKNKTVRAMTVLESVHHQPQETVKDGVKFHVNVGRQSSASAIYNISNLRYAIANCSAVGRTDRITKEARS